MRPFAQYLPQGPHREIIMPISAKKISNNSRTEASGLGKLRNVLPAVHVECREKNSDADHNTTAKMNAEARWESVVYLYYALIM